MQYLIINIIVVILGLFILYYLRQQLDARYISFKENIIPLKDSYEDLSNKARLIEAENRYLSQNSEASMQIYEVTKDISVSLDKKEVFDIFKDRLGMYIDFKDCQFIEEMEDVEKLNGYEIFPAYYGFLAIQGLNQADRDNFIALSNQFNMVIMRARLYEKIEETAIIDNLTCIYSRRHVLERLDEELQRSKKFGLKLSFLMSDVDHFKRYNDRFGHLVGDVILRDIASTIKSNIRQIDLVGRFGGEEFSVILPETSKEGALFAGERIRKAVEEKKIKAYDESLKVSISVGIAVFPDNAHDLQELIDKSDFSLYRAKQTGRNKVCVYGLYR